MHLLALEIKRHHLYFTSNIYPNHDLNLWYLQLIWTQSDCCSFNLKIEVKFRNLKLWRTPFWSVGFIECNASLTKITEVQLIRALSCLNLVYYICLNLKGEEKFWSDQEKKGLQMALPHCMHKCLVGNSRLWQWAKLLINSGFCKF